MFDTSRSQQFSDPAMHYRTPSAVQPTKGFIYDGRTFNGHLLDSGEHYSVFTDGKELFEGEAQRIAGKSEAQAKHVWALGGK